MKTLKALFWGGIVGYVLGRLFAPRHADMLRAELLESQSSQQGAATGGTGQRQTAGGTRTRTGASRTARYVGNMHTKVYHEASDSNLPSEENRAYFSSAEEAEAQGYRHVGSLPSSV